MRWGSKKKRNYLAELWKRQTNLYAALGALALGTLLALPFGFGVGLIPPLLYGAGFAIAALFIPGSRGFQAMIDQEKAHEERERARGYMLGELQQRVGLDHPYWGLYERMIQRRNSLRKLAGEQETALHEEEVERLDDATVDFLGVWLARIAIDERRRTFSADDLDRKLAELDRALESANDANDKRRLIKAKANLEELRRKRDEMVSRDAAMEARMFSMADTFDEVYQRVMANPTSRDEVTTGLRVAIERMNLEEELDHVLEEEVDAFLGA